MTSARAKQISLVDTKYYHCSSKCTRHAFLSGKDPYTGKSYDHRKQWVEEKLSELVKIFCVDLCAYAVTQDHLHLVLRADDEKAMKLSDKEVLTRYHKMFRGTELTQRFVVGNKINKGENVELKDAVNEYRERLYNISWFMKQIKEHIARMANLEESDTGIFWERRFKVQALLDDPSLVACMAYVDLKPIQENLAKTPKGSKQSSIKKRIELAVENKQPATLLKFVGERKKSSPKGIPVKLENYLKLIESTGRSIRNENKIAVNPEDPILTQLNINPENWITLTTEFDTLRGPVGRVEAMQGYCDSLNIKRRSGFSQCKKLFN